MEFSSLIKEDGAVSPVIGVILMVAITVILAAVIGTFVLGLGDQVQTTAPNAQMTFDYTHSATADDQELRVTHEGGDSVSAAQVFVRASGSDNENADLCDSADVDTTVAGADDVQWSGELSAGSSCLITGDLQAASGTADVFSTNPLADTTVRATWESEEGGSSSTLREWSRN